MLGCDLRVLYTRALEIVVGTIPEFRWIKIKYHKI